MIFNTQRSKEPYSHLNKYVHVIIFWQRDIICQLLVTKNDDDIFKLSFSSFQQDIRLGIIVE